MITEKSKTKQEFEKYAQQAITQTTLEVCVNDAHKLIYIKTKQMLEHTHTHHQEYERVQREVGD